MLVSSDEIFIKIMNSGNETCFGPVQLQNPIDNK